MRIYEKKMQLDKKWCENIFFGFKLPVLQKIDPRLILSLKIAENDANLKINDAIW